MLVMCVSLSLSTLALTSCVSMAHVRLGVSRILAQGFCQKDMASKKLILK